jgi:branched-chain amino acid transport system substrate-binding protein
VRGSWIARGALVVLAGVAGMAACRRGDSAVRIGVVVDADGIVGARFAVDDARASGGIGDRPLELVVVPPRMATVAEPSILAADSLSADPSVVAVVGHSNSSASLAASQVYNARRLVHIAPNTTAPLFGEAGPYSFRLVPDDHRQADLLARLVARAGARRVAIAFVNDDYGRALSAAVRDRLARAGTRPVYETPYLEGGDTTQLLDAARSVADARPDLLLWLGRARELSIFLVPLRARLGALPIYASDGVDVSMTYAAPRRVA